MESPASSSAESPPEVTAEKEKEETVPLVDPFLVEALQKPRHRLTVLRMELDIQRFMQNPELQQFEFQPFPTSYLKRCAHRVAQHYGLQTASLDKIVIVRKTPESKLPSVCLSEVPAQKTEKEEGVSENIKIVVRPNQNIRILVNGSNKTGDKDRKVSPRSVQERKEEYDKARARIFSGCVEMEAPVPLEEHKDVNNKHGDKSNSNNNNYTREEVEVGSKGSSGAGMVAIFRDRAKDLTDPDYDRSYVRYVRGAGQYFSPGANNTALVSPYVTHDASTVPYLQMSGSAMNPHFAFAYNTAPSYNYNQTSNQWPNPPPVYTNSYMNFAQGLFYQQPLSLERMQNC